MNNEQKSESFSFEEVFGSPVDCGRGEEFIRYFENALTDKDKTHFEEHLTDCAWCAKQLSGLQESALAADATILDPVKADAIFQKNRVQLKNHLNTVLGLKAEPARSFLPFAIPGYVQAFLILALALLTYPAYRSIVLDREVGRLQSELSLEKSKVQPPVKNGSEEMKLAYEKQIQQLVEEKRALVAPTLSGSAVYSVRTERGVETEKIQWNFSGQQKSFSTLFSVQATGFESYVVEISQGDQVVWQNEVPSTASKDSPAALLSISVRGESFQDGDYRLRILGKNGAQVSTLGEYRLAIKHN